jgi:hypothetical protein
MVDNSENNDSGLSEVIQIRFRDEDFVFESNTEGVLNLVQKVATKYGNSVKEEFTNFLRSQYVQWSSSGYKMDIGKIEQALFTFNEPVSTRFGVKDLGTQHAQKSPNTLLIIIGVLSVSLTASLFFLFLFRAQAIERATVFADVVAETIHESESVENYVGFVFTGDEVSIVSKNVQVDDDCSSYYNSYTRSICREKVEIIESINFLYSGTSAMGLMLKLEVPERIIQLFMNTTASDGPQSETVNNTKAGTIVVSWTFNSSNGMFFSVSRQCQSTCYKVDLPSVDSSTSETKSSG